MNLLDFLQSASNAAAGNVSGPVDLVSTLLNKLGVPVQNPVGGSEWMKQKGLMRDVQQSPSSLAGETFGLLAPIGVAAKAPQIASGLLKAGENAAIPRQMNPQMGAIVYHGSPHKFDKFDSSKIGTGEGAQAYGHGLYLADESAVAKGYAESLSPGKNAPDRWLIGDRPAKGNVADGAAVLVAQQGKDGALGTLRGLLASSEKYSGSGANKYQDNLRKQIDLIESGKVATATENTGNLYKVDLPDEAIAKMLDWDKPLSQQAPEVRDFLGKTKAAGIDGPDSAGDIFSRLGFYDQLMPKDAAKAMRAQGIPGIRYLDGGSRGAGTGTSNYVVFPGAEDLLKILERNGVAP
jgi:hypothetical protein